MAEEDKNPVEPASSAPEKLPVSEPEPPQALAKPTVTLDSLVQLEEHRRTMTFEKTEAKEKPEKKE